jgi:hypothetical protein
MPTDLASIVVEKITVTTKILKIPHALKMIESLE